jgi:hypothetical protein
MTSDAFFNRERFSRPDYELARNINVESQTIRWSSIGREQRDSTLSWTK